MHIDLDAFFASVEQRDHPQWRGLPVVVGAKLGDGLLWLEMEALVQGRLLPQELPISRILIQSSVLAAASPFIVAIASPIDQRTSFGWRMSDSEP